MACEPGFLSELTQDLAGFFDPTPGQWQIRLYEELGAARFTRFIKAGLQCRAKYPQAGTPLRGSLALVCFRRQKEPLLAAFSGKSWSRLGLIAAAVEMIARPADLVVPG